jgi:hypothetical protein
MEPKATTIEAARAGKEQARRRFARLPGVVGIGLTRCGLGYAIKINVDRPVAPGTIPGYLDGVPIVTECVGSISKAVS